MNVLEISPGMDRSGNNLVKLVGEATQSHTVVCKGSLHACSLPSCVSKAQSVLATLMIRCNALKFLICIYLAFVAYC